MFDIAAQVIVVILGTSSIILIDRKSKWGIVCALASQPFWIYTAFYHHQWGIFLVQWIYTVGWLYGVYRWFHHSRKLHAHKLTRKR